MSGMLTNFAAKRRSVPGLHVRRIAYAQLSANAK
ncbi:hypothetical protein FOTG_15115 [Fusarium oxysporum f. sp. vasinfectum 25433]|uniref:Uncharacterized protein n=1 Tax=Fusarium oxysporum f. sp. vasinfectum 25433 TaxID=1089449 RepID=X0M7H6_FUSOX|nr:hypothetical protein FOTG_15115 [Fusarium oxysporum f. sp. vasinfectum 25433]